MSLRNCSSMHLKSEIFSMILVSWRPKYTFSDICKGCLFQAFKATSFRFFWFHIMLNCDSFVFWILPLRYRYECLSVLRDSFTSLILFLSFLFGDIPTFIVLCLCGCRSKVYASLTKHKESLSVRHYSYFRISTELDTCMNPDMHAFLICIIFYPESFPIITSQSIYFVNSQSVFPS